MKMPIHSLEKVKSVYPILCAQGDNLIADFWQVQFNMGLRFGDCLSITVGEAKYALKFGEIHKVEAKTEKMRVIGMNAEVSSVFEKLIVGKGDNEYIFSEGGRKKVVKLIGGKDWGDIHGGKLVKIVNTGFYSREYYSRKLKAVAELLGLDPDEIASHTARKSWAYHQRISLGESLEKVSEAMGHSSVQITLRYAGLSRKEIGDMGRRSF